MIGSLKGTVDSLGIDNCIIETAGGVGYRVFMPAAQLAQLTQGASVRLHIHTAVREGTKTKHFSFLTKSLRY